jgi:hypothetical protein
VVFAPLSGEPHGSRSPLGAEIGSWDGSYSRGGWGPQAAATIGCGPLALRGRLGRCLGLCLRPDSDSAAKQVLI